MRFVTILCATEVALGVGLSSARAGEVSKTIIDFSVKENATGARMNAWGGDRKGRCFYDEEASALHLWCTNSNATFSSPRLDANIGRLLENGTATSLPTKYYVRYKVIAQNGGAQIHYNTTESYSSRIGFRRDGCVHENKVVPGGWNKNGTPFDHGALKSIYLAFSGSVDILIYEIGAIFRETSKAMADPTPVDTDAVKVFPEPEVFEESGDVLSLSGFASPVVEGDGIDYAARWFETEMTNFYGQCFSAAGHPIRFRIIGSDANKGRIRYDGYAIRVREDGVDVVGTEPMGVMNGVRTLAILIKEYSGDVGPARIRAMDVLDSPRLKYRMLHQTMSCYWHRNRYEPDDYADRLERFAVDARFNRFSFELGEFYRYRSAPGTGEHPQSWTADDFSRVVHRLNEIGAVAVPFVQSPGHQALGLFASKDVAPELREDGHKDVMCTRHPDSYRFLFGVFDEVCGICGSDPKFKSDVFYAGGDEVRWKRGIPYESRCRYCRDVPYNRLYSDHMTKVDEWCRQHGYQMLMCSDMIVDNHNGFDAFMCSETRDRLPKGIALAHWATMDFEEMESFAKSGYDNWKLLTGYQDSPAGEDVVKGYGLALYNYNWWLSRTRAMDQGVYGLMAIRLCGAQAWGVAPVHEGEWKEKISRWGNFLMRNWSRKPIPRGTFDFSTVDLSQSVNCRLTGSFDWTVSELSHVPVKIAKGGDGVPMGVCAGTNGIGVAIGKNASSLAFLHTAELPESERKAFYLKGYKDETDGPVIAKWKVYYEDGTSSEMDVKYGWNVGAWNRGVARNAVFERFITDARYSWSDPDGNTVYLHEWVNPHPEKRILHLTLIKVDERIDYRSFALTVRGVR